MEDPVTDTINNSFYDEMLKENKEFLLHIKNAYFSLFEKDYCCYALPDETKAYFLNKYPGILCKFLNLGMAIYSHSRCIRENKGKLSEMYRRLVEKLTEEFEEEVFKAYENFNKSMITYVETKENNAIRK